MPKMRAAQIARPNGPLEIVEREIPGPGAGQDAPTHRHRSSGHT